jgi:hypothetical protein
MTVHNHFYCIADIENTNIVIKERKGDEIVINFKRQTPKKFMQNWYKKLHEFINEEQSIK